MSASPLKSDQIPDGYGLKPLKKVLAAAESEGLTNEAIGMSDLATSMDKALTITKKEMIARQTMSKKEIVATDVLSFPFEELMEIGEELATEFLKQNTAINQGKTDPWANTNNLNFVFAKTYASWAKAVMAKRSLPDKAAINQAEGNSNEARN